MYNCAKCSTFVPLIVIGMENNFTSQQEKIAKMLLTMRAFHLQSSTPFTFRNGWKAPFYLDDRKILSYIYSRNLVKIEMAHTILRHFPDADVIAGIAPNAIAFGVLMAQDLGLPFVSVYHTPKKHGLENQIEGDVRPKQKVVLMGDLADIAHSFAYGQRHISHKLITVFQRKNVAHLGQGILFKHFPYPQLEIKWLYHEIQPLINK